MSVQDLRPVEKFEVGWMPDVLILKATFEPREGEPTDVVIALDPRQANEIAQAIVENAKEAIYAAVMASNVAGAMKSFAIQRASDEPELRSEAID